MLRPSLLKAKKRSTRDCSAPYPSPAVSGSPCSKLRLSKYCNTERGRRAGEGRRGEGRGAEGRGEINVGVD